MYKVVGTFSIEIKKAPLEITGISVLGSKEVQIPEVEEVTHVYTLEIKDQYGDIVTPNGSITWSLTNDLPGVDLTFSDNTQAVVTIAAGTLEHTFNLRAMAENGVYGEVEINLTLEEVKPELLYALVGAPTFSEHDQIQIFDVEDLLDFHSELFNYRINNIALTTGAGSDEYLYTMSGGDTLEQERRLRKLDAKTLAVLQESSVFTSMPIPTNIFADSDFVYASFRDQTDVYGSIRKFNATTLEFVSQSPDFGAIQKSRIISDGDFLYIIVGTYQNETIKKIKKENLQEVDSISTPTFFGFAVGGDYVYYGLRPFDTPDTLNRLNKHTFDLEYSAEFGEAVGSITTLIADDSHLYAETSLGTISKLDLSFNILTEQDIGASIGDIVQDSEFLYAGSASSPNTITKLRKSDLEILETSSTFGDRLFALRR